MGVQQNAELASILNLFSAKKKGILTSVKTSLFSEQCDLKDTDLLILSHRIILVRVAVHLEAISGR